MSFFRQFSIVSLAVIMTVVVSQLPVSAGDDPWPDIRQSMFQARAIAEGSNVVQLFAPNQADDAALVPISIKIPASAAVRAKSLTIIIDRNPAPVAATFTFGDGFRLGPASGERTLATRIRIDAFSRVRAILETTDDELHMASKFVIGAGGCSAPASKDPDEAVAQLGKAQLKLSKNDNLGTRWRDAQIMIRHPNFTGMQMNKKTGNFTPARFVNLIEVKQGNALLFRMDGGISISEDPNIRMSFETDSEQALDFVAKDTDGIVFTATSAADPS